MNLNIYKKQLKNFASIFTILILIILISNSKTQAQTEPGRYHEPIFTSVTSTKNIKYTQNRDLNGQMQDLMLDLYEPANDTLAKRPVILYLHQGSFQNGSRTDSTALVFSNYFAHRGYVVASLSYRLGIANLLDPTAYAEAIFRATQDARAGIRFMRANANQYRIDTSKIYIGGGSAGAITAIHAAYLDMNSVPAYMDTSKLGGLDAGGNPGFSNEVDGVVNLFGAILDTNWINPGEAPIVSIHGEKDPTVPYKFANFGMFSLYGSYNIHQRAMHLDIKNKLKSFPNAGHGFEPGDTASADTTIRVVRDFLFTLTTGIDSMPVTVYCPAYQADDVALYPNPATNFVNIINFSSANIQSASIISLSGQQLFSYRPEAGKENILQLKLPYLSPGIYLLKFENSAGKFAQK